MRGATTHELGSGVTGVVYVIKSVWLGTLASGNSFRKADRRAIGREDPPRRP
jgi:hypothetical protein